MNAPTNTRMGIYDFLYSVISNAVSKNVYRMERPQELTEADTTVGFIVLRVGQTNDRSEFIGRAYTWARAYVEAYIPPKSRGRLDVAKFTLVENEIRTAVSEYFDKEDDLGYSIDSGSLLSMDDYYSTNKDNTFHVFTLSFVIYNNYKD